MSVTSYRYNIHFHVHLFSLTSWVELHLRSIELLYEPDLKISFTSTCHLSCFYLPLSAELCDYTHGTQHLSDKCTTTDKQQNRGWNNLFVNVYPNLESNKASIRLELFGPAGSLWNMPLHESGVFCFAGILLEYS